MIGSTVAQSHINSQFEADEQNRKAVRKSIGAAAALPDDLAELYELHYSAIGTQLPDYPAEVAAALYVACRKHLVLGTTALFRRYASQAFRETRAAVEAAGIASAIRRDEESFRIFREDQGSGESRRAARNRFTSGTLFGGDLARLKDLYDKASERSHTNRRTFGHHLNLSEGTFSYQDLRDEDIPRQVTNYLIWISAAHLTILEVADLVFPDAEGDAVANFKTERQYLGERICRFGLQNKEAYLEASEGC
jgi:hypothetical protein